MITINRENGYIILSRCEYLYRDGLDKRDEKASREMGDGDIIIPLPAFMVETTYDHTGRTDGQNAVTIVDEIRRQLEELVKLREALASIASAYGNDETAARFCKGLAREALDK